MPTSDRNMIFIIWFFGLIYKEFRCKNRCRNDTLYTRTIFNSFTFWLTANQNRIIKCNQRSFYWRNNSAIFFIQLMRNYWFHFHVVIYVWKKDHTFAVGVLAKCRGKPWSFPFIKCDFLILLLNTAGTVR